MGSCLLPCSYERDKEVCVIQRVNELFGKEVISYTNGEKLGTVQVSCSASGRMTSYSVYKRYVTGS